MLSQPELVIAESELVLFSSLLTPIIHTFRLLQEILPVQLSRTNSR